METLGAYDTETTVGVTQNEDCIGLSLTEKLIGAVDDIAAGGSQIIAYCIHVYFGFCQLEVTEEDAVEIVVIVLSCMGKYTIKIFTAFVDYCCKTDDFRAGADYYQEFELAVILEMDI